MKMAKPIWAGKGRNEGSLFDEIIDFNAAGDDVLDISDLLINFDCTFGEKYTISEPRKGRPVSGRILFATAEQIIGRFHQFKSIITTFDALKSILN